MSEPRTVDLTGIKCPGPIVQLNAEMKGAAGGELLAALSDDPAFELDIKAWCRRTGNDLVQLSAAGGVIKAVIRRKA